MEHISWIVLLPPFIVLLLTAFTRRLLLSLSCGILSAGLIATHGSASGTFALITKRALNHLSKIDNIYLYAFLFAIGILVYLLEYTGSAQAFARLATRSIRSKRGAETASLLLSTTLFIDDYLSGLTVGCIMRPIADRFGVARQKLAYLVHSMASPLVILMPISSWIAMFVEYLTHSGVASTMEAETNPVYVIADPLFIFFRSIPFIVYGIITVFATIMIVQKRISFGPMRICEREASHHPEGYVHPQGHLEIASKSSPFDLIFPIGILVISFVLGVLYAGDFWLFGGKATVLESFKNNTQTFLILLISSICALTTNAFIAWRRKSLSIAALPSITRDGIKTMIPSVSMLILVSVLSDILSTDLGAGTYIAQLLLSALPTFLLPLTFFLVATLVSLILGTSWGTIGLLLPLAIPTIVSYAAVATPTAPSMLPLLFPVLGALFSGAVCGDHLSPISQTTVMVASACGVDPIEHARTQFFYGLPVIVSSALAFLLFGLLIPLGLTLNATISLASGIVACWALLKTCNK